MKVKELIRQLKRLPQDDDIVITSMDDYFFCENFEIATPFDNAQAQEIILPYYIIKYKRIDED